MAGADKLYTPELLGLAVSLADYPFDEGSPHRGSARSRSCGSTLETSLSLDPEGRIARVGLREQCGRRLTHGAGAHAQPNARDAALQVE